MSEAQHSIKFAARKSGLSQHVIRVWEKRYEAVSPNRTDTNRRRYSDAEIERLTLLRAATLAGHSIGNVAQLSTDKLRELAAEHPVPARRNDLRETAATQLIEAALVSVMNNDALNLEAILGRAAVQLGNHGLLENMIAPLAHQLGDLWLKGQITAAHEHFASAIIRNFFNPPLQAVCDERQHAHHRHCDSSRPVA